MRALLLLPVAACATTGAVTCPDPIGAIVRDDCDAYRVRYETVGVKLGANALGLAGASVELRDRGQSASELVQLMAHQVSALCGDFNACRLTTADYLERRERLDRRFAIVSALAAQLESPALAPADRARLLARMLEALDAPVSAPRVAREVATKKSYPPRRWFGAKHRPPLPAPVKPGFPILLDTWEPIHLQHLSHQPPAPRDGYAPRLEAHLLGRVDPDDTLIVHFGEQEVRCPTKKSTKGEIELVQLSCPAPEDHAHHARRQEVRVSYERGADGTRAELGRLAFSTLERRGDEGTREGIHTIGVDYDPTMELALLAFRPEPYALPPDHERPVLQAVLRLREHLESTLRCAVNGQVVTGAIRSAGAAGGGQLGTYQDRERYERVSPSSSRGVQHPFVEWWRAAFPLPFVVSHGGPLPEGTRAWGEAAGEWLCTLTVEGQALRELRFTVERGGAIGLHPTQQGRPGDFASEAFRVDVRRLENTVETSVERGK